MPARANPNSLTVDQLTRELKSRNIVLPKSSNKKEILVDLYKKHILNEAAENNQTVYSSDDDAQEEPNSHSQTLSAADIQSLSDSELRTRLRSFDKNVGPITNTTRSVYKKKLAKFISGKLTPANMDDVSAVEVTYSDTEEEDECAVEEDESVVETHDVSVQNDFDERTNGGQGDGVNNGSSRKVTKKIEVYETNYTKTVRDSQLSHGSAWSGRYEDLNTDSARIRRTLGPSNVEDSNFDSARIRRSLMPSSVTSEGYSSIKPRGAYDDMPKLDEIGSAPNRDFHRRSLALYGLTSRPPISTYASSRVTPTRVSSYAQDNDDDLRPRESRSEVTSGMLKRNVAKSGSSCARNLLVALVVILILASFGYLVYLNVEPDFLPKSLLNRKN